MLVLYKFINSDLSSDSFLSLLDKLPNNLQADVRIYRRREDQLSRLYGKLMLKHGIQRLGLNKISLDDLKYSKYGRPFISNMFDFNISHSGNLVVCAISTQYTVGVDVEEIKPLNLNEFKSQFSIDEWNIITKASNSVKTFYELWTKKEALVKANGKGLFIELPFVVLKPGGGIIEDTFWYIKPLNISSEYVVQLCASKSINKICLEPFNSEL